jgi:iron complex transport system ATP-binding protein
VEEIMPVFTHALLLKSGEVLALGKKRDMLHSNHLSEAFESRVTLRDLDGRYSLSVAPSARVVI